MDGDATSRAARAARNEALFRALNGKLDELRDRFQPDGEPFAVACECADTSCIEMFAISPEEYAGVRRDARRFVVLPGHVSPEFERVVAERGGFAVVEKTGEAGEHARAEASRLG